jgi:hypothetical protein
MGRGAFFLNRSDHLHFDGVDFDPAAPPIISRTDRNGHVTRYANIFSGFAVEPKRGDCQLYLQHMKYNICGGDEMLYESDLNWMASGVQHPDNPGRTAISMRGDPGVGKGVWAIEYGKIFGRHFLHLTNSEKLTQKFNAISGESLLIFADEAMFAGDRKAAQVLKTLISESTKTVEPKGIDSFTVPNYARYVFATNDDHPLLIEDKDRRITARYVLPNHEKDRPYFRAIADQMKNGGRAALLYLLLERDISNFNSEDIPNNAELLKRKVYSAPAGDRVIISFAQDGYLPGALVDMPGHKRDRPWIARSRGDGCLLDEMKRRGGRDMNYMDEVKLTDILKEWKFVRHPLGDGAGWKAPPLDELRRKLSEKYPGIEWDNPDVTEWGARSEAEAAEQVEPNAWTDLARHRRGRF